MTPHMYGPNHQVIQQVIDEHMYRLDRNRVASMMLMARLSERTERAQRHAFTAARAADELREEQMIRASEALRAETWNVVWDSRWDEAWIVSWIAARLGLGLATYDLIGFGEYSIGDYMALVGPWTTGGFSDLPLGRGT